MVCSVGFSQVTTLPCSGVKLQALANAAENYQVLLAENRKLFNEIQELRGATTLLAYICCICVQY